MKSSLQLVSLASLGALVSLSANEAAADQRLRVQVDQRGDFVMVGNTLGWDCGASADMPVVGQVSTSCGSGTMDSAPDMFWRSDEPVAGQARADLSVMPADARSTAVLTLPAGAVPTHAFLYWGATRPAGSPADTDVVLERPGVFSESLSAVASYTKNVAATVTGGVAYQSVADVTDLVMEHGPGAYRVSGVAASPFANVNEEVRFAGWALVVLYQLPSEPPRNLAIFDGLDAVQQRGDSNVALSGFLVPNAGFDAKLGVITYEGDDSYDGDSLLFGTAPLDSGDVLSDQQNPATNFFNGTRSLLGSPVSVSGDLPQLKGTKSTMAGMDLDVIDVTRRMTAGQTRVDLRATTALDEYYLGAFITSISTFRPDFITSEKTVRDVNGGFVKGGDELEYTITVKNTGNDASDKTVLTDPLPDTVTFVPGSISVSAGANMGAKTDAPGDDQASYDPASRTLTIHVGSGASATNGGSIPVGESSVVKFRVKVNDNVNGVISNQGTITAGGQRGAPPVTTVTDGNADAPGNPPTDIPSGECQQDAMCGGQVPFCDLKGDPPICVECTMDSQCKGAEPVCDPGTRTCVECTMDSQCKGPESVCDTATHMCVCAGKPGSCIDTDGDGLSDPDEIDIGTDPKDADTDDDGVPDGEEKMPGVDSDGDGKVNALDPDSDNDGLKDGTEQGKGCNNPGTNVAKGNCVPDADNGATTTDPLDADTDDGGATDGAEDENHNGAIDPGERDPTAGHGADDKSNDADGDGLSDGNEDTIGTDPNDADSDDDGVRDGDEPNYDQDTDGDGKINALDPDSDNDGIKDGTELGKDCSDPATDPAPGNCVPDADMGATTTSPVNRDTDGGGVSDGDEDVNHNGSVDPAESDPNLACDDNPSRTCSNLDSLAGAGGCSARLNHAEERSAVFWLSGVVAAFWWTARRRRRR